MLALGQDEIAKYPFLADAGQYLKDTRLYTRSIWNRYLILKQLS